MDTNAMLDALGKIADEIAKLVALVKTEQETTQAMGQPTNDRRVPGLPR